VYYHHQAKQFTKWHPSTDTQYSFIACTMYKTEHFSDWRLPVCYYYMECRWEPPVKVDFQTQHNNAKQAHVPENIFL